MTTNKLKGRAPKVRYCPLHEYEIVECDEWCEPRRIELKVLDVRLRNLFRVMGYYRTRQESA